MIIFDTKADVHLSEGGDFLPQNLCHQRFFYRLVIHIAYIYQKFFFYYELITDSAFIYHFDTMHFFFMEGHARTFMSFFLLNQLIRKVKSVSFD